MTFLKPVSSFVTGYFSAPYTPLQRAILERTDRGTITHSSYGGPVIEASLDSVANAVESAYVLTPKTDLPKVTASPGGSFDVEGIGSLWPQDSRTAENTRKRAAAWLAITQHLEVEETAKAYEASKAKQVADSMAGSRTYEAA